MQRAFIIRRCRISQASLRNRSTLVNVNGDGPLSLSLKNNRPSSNPNDDTINDRRRRGSITHKYSMSRSFGSVSSSLSSPWSSPWSSSWSSSSWSSSAAFNSNNWHSQSDQHGQIQINNRPIISTSNSRRTIIIVTPTNNNNNDGVPNQNQSSTIIEADDDTNISRSRSSIDSTTTTTTTSQAQQNHNNQSSSSSSIHNIQNIQYHEPFTGHQKSLLEYTQSITLPSFDDNGIHVIGTLSYAQLVQISNCIHQWISTGEHRYLGAEQAERLMKRLIVERGGGRSLVEGGGVGGVVGTGAVVGTGVANGSKRRRNENVTWEMYQFFPVVQYFNVLYSGKEFVDRVLSIVNTFDLEYVNDDDDDDDDHSNENDNDSDDNQHEHYLEVPYKTIISCLCDRRTPHAAAAAERILHNFESRLLRPQLQTTATAAASPPSSREVEYHHSNPPGVETYNSILTAWKASESVRYPPSCEPEEYFHHPNPCSNLLCEMLERYNNGNGSEVNDNDNNGGGDGDERSVVQRIRPDFLTFNTAISSLAKEQSDLSWSLNGGAKNGSGSGNEYYRTIGKQCHRHLTSMLQLHEEGHERCAPDLITFSTVINALGRGKDRGDEGRARELLDAMLRLSGEGDVGGRGATGDASRLDSDSLRSAEYEYDVVPRNKHFNVVLALMARSNRRLDIDTLQRARRYVDVMERLGRNEETHGTPRTNDEAPGNPTMMMMEDIMRSGEEVDEEEEERGERMVLSMASSAPDIVTYNTLLNIAARAGRPETAEGILDGMIEKSSRDGGGGVKPDVVSFNTVLSAWAKSKNPKGKLRTEQILLRMQEMYENGDTSVRPDRASLTTVITAITSAARSDGSAPIKAERIVDRMEANDELSLRPDVVTYTSLIKCWNESGRPRAADRAEEIVKSLHQRYDDGHAECKPDTLVYNVAMNALAKSDAPNTGERAEALLNRMQDHYYAGDADLAPTTQSFSTAIQAWARSKNPHGATKAEKLLQTMHDLEASGDGNVSPNTIAYSTCILAWRNSRRSDAGERADALLEKMEGYQEKGLTDLKPNAIAYTNAMEAWISSHQSNSLEKVEAILERMIERSKRECEYSESGYSDSAPTTTTINVVMKAIQNSSHPTKHVKAEQLLNRMKQLYEDGDSRVKPNIRTYNIFFSACAMAEGNSENRQAAFSLVVNALIELQDSNHLLPDAYTWPAVWKACQNLLDVKKDFAWINRIFELTIKSGSVNELLFNNMRGFLPPQYLQKKLKTKEDVHQLTVHDLPPEWTCNTKIRRKRKGNQKSHPPRRTNAVQNARSKAQTK